MTGPVRPTIALAQIDPTVGDIDGNAAAIREWSQRAHESGAEIVVFPELCLPGYPAEDLYLKRHFALANVRALEVLAAEATDVAIVVGFAEPVAEVSRAGPDAPVPRPVHNSLALLDGGRVRAVYRKHRLPNYAVFDEQRYFEPGTEPLVAEVRGLRIGFTICEDVWEPGPPASLEAEAGAELIVNASGSPYLRGKGGERERMFGDRARRYGVPLAFCNLVGGQDELVFDGHSFVVDSSGAIVARARQFAEEMLLWAPGGASLRLEQPLGDLDEVYEALLTGLRDYVRKNRFEHVVVGVSGGIDSSLVAVLAADALGADRVTCVVMPSPHSSAETQADARRLAANLGVELLELPIEPAMHAYGEMLDGTLLGPAEREETGAGGPGAAAELAAENIQARIRGNLLMALSNARGWLVLTTGNKSEMSVGYATLYGDMAGGLAVIKDVPKQLVYRLVEHRNRRAGTDLVPASVIARAPSAELRPGQRDDDSLPPYEVLDRVLEAYIERDLSREQIVAEGTPAAVVEEVIRLVDRAEYKRRQAPPGIRITTKAFGRDRRLPITNRFSG